MKIENISISNIDIDNGTATLTFDIAEITNSANIDLKIDDGEFTQILENQEQGTITYDLTNMPRGIHDLALKISNEEEEYISEPFLVKFKVNPTIEGLECTYSDSTGKFILKFTILGDELFTYNVNFKLDENEYQEIMTSQIMGEKTFESISEMGSHTCVLKISDGYDKYETDVFTFDITNQKPILSKVLAKDISNDGSANICYGVKDIENSTLTHYLNIDGTNEAINPTRLNSFYTYKISGLSVGNHTCFISVTDGIDTVTTDEVNIEIFANSTDKKEILRQSKARYDFAYQSLKDIITSVVSDSVFDYDVENEIIQKAQESYNETYSEFNRIAQQSIDIIGTNKVNLTKEDLTSQINDVDNALNSLETTMEGVFRDGLLSDSEKILLSDNLNIIAKEKVDVDRDYETLYNNEDLLDPAKSKLQTNYNAFVVAQNSLATLIDNIIKKDSIIDNEDKANIDSAFEAWRNALGNYRNASLEAIDSIAKKKADDSSDIVNERWAEIILDPESGIQSQVGQLYDKVSGTGGIEQRLTTAEQTITTEGITNLIKDTYYSKEEIDETIEDIRDDIHVAVASVDVQYYLSTSQTSLVGGSWSSVAPTWVNGKYMWSKTVTTLTDGTVSESAPTCIAGAKGDSASPNYTWIRYADDANGNGISNSPEGKDYIGFAYNKTTSTESNTPSDYVWSLIKGKDGTDGTNGINGTNGKDGTTYYTWIKYSNSSDGSNMYDTPNADTLYIGIATNQTSITESTDKTKYTWSKFRGDDGVDGTDGKDGTEIVSITEQYYLSTSNTTQVNGSWVETPPAWQKGKYLWTRTKIVYANPSSTKYTTPVCDTSWEISNDVQEQIDNNKTEIETMKDTVAIHTTNLNNITSRVSTTETQITTINGNITNMNSRINTAEQKITDSAIINTVSSTIDNRVSEGIDGIQVGERNLLLNSGTEQTITNSTFISYSFANVSYVSSYVAGKEVTATFEAKKTSGTADIHVYFRNSSDVIQPSSAKIGDITTEYKKYSITFTAPTNLSSVNNFSINSTYNVGLTVRNMKLVLGNKATDWTPAPEEIQNQISSIEQTATQIQSTVSSHTGNISTLTQRADSFDITLAGKADTSNIISKINASTEGITISSSKVNITGFVTFSNLSGAGQTTINGGNITTGTIDASKVTVRNLNASYITSGTIDASDINVININASNITSGYISGNRINGGTITGTLFKTYTRTSSGGVEITSDALQIGYTTFHYADSRFKIETNANFSLSSMADIHIMAGLNQNGTVSGNGKVYIYTDLVVEGKITAHGGVTAVFG